MPKDAFGPGIVQRNSRELLFKIKKDKAIYLLTGSTAIFVFKDTLSQPDTEALIVKRSGSWIGPPAGPGDDTEIEFVLLTPPNGGAPVLWGLKVILGTADIPAALPIGEYFIQVDIIPPLAPEKRFTPVQGFLTIKETGIQTL